MNNKLIALNFILLLLILPSPKADAQTFDLACGYVDISWEFGEVFCGTDVVLTYEEYAILDPTPFHCFLVEMDGSYADSQHGWWVAYQTYDHDAPVYGAPGGGEDTDTLYDDGSRWYAELYAWDRTYNQWVGYVPGVGTTVEHNDLLNADLFGNLWYQETCESGSADHWDADIKNLDPMYFHDND